MKTNDKSSSKGNRIWQSVCKGWAQQMTKVRKEQVGSVRPRHGRKQKALAAEQRGNPPRSEPREWPLIEWLIEELLNQINEMNNYKSSA